MARTFTEFMYGQDSGDWVDSMLLLWGVVAPEKLRQLMNTTTPGCHDDGRQHQYIIIRPTCTWEVQRKQLTLYLHIYLRYWLQL